MKRGTKIEWGYDRYDQPVLQIVKKRGKLTLAEIEDILRYENGQQWCGYYAIILNCSEATVDGGSLFLMPDDPGDAVDLYKLEEGEPCPVCEKAIPPFEYCPSCGTAWKDMNLNVETRIASMREETVRMINEAKRPEGRTAWYWTYIGALDMARQLGFITDKRRQELYKEVEHLKPQAAE